MSNHHSLLSEPLKPHQTSLPPSAQAQLTIPTGTVSHILQQFESHIATHHHEQTSIYTTRALANTDNLIRRGRTYTQHLRLAETLGLSHLPSHLRSFIHDHDNAHRAVLRSRDFADLTRARPEAFDVFARIGARVIHASGVHTMNTVRATRKPGEWRRMAYEPFFRSEVQECTDLLVDECVRVLKRLDTLRLSIQSESEEIELENVGPDHDVLDFGSQIPLPSPPSQDNAFSVAEKPVENILDAVKYPTHDETYRSIAKNTETDTIDSSNRCCICLEIYTPSHPPFTLTACTHTLGLQCLSTWLNSTAANATSCPYCRTLLCDRRARQPSSRSRDAYAEVVRLEDRLKRARWLLVDLDGLCAMVYGGVVGKWFCEGMRAVSERAGEMGVGVGNVWEDGMIGL